MNDYNIMQWLAIGFAAFFVGLSKTGIPGIGIFAVGLFATVIPARESSGVVLPLLILADMVAVASYWRDAHWKQLIRLFPWAISGIVIAWLVMDHINELQTRRLIGLILTAMAAMQLWRSAQRRRRASAGILESDDMIAHSRAYTGTMGLLAGFTTMAANAAGPIMNLYLIAMRMPKMMFMGTAAWYFFLLNSFKVPFSINLGLINRESLMLNACLAPAVLAGAMLGRLILPRINQKVFEALALGFVIIAGLRLLFF